jgi:hypothetical protein
MAKCPWNPHQVPDLASGDLDVGDTGQCTRCNGKYTVEKVNPYKLVKRGKKKPT